MLLTFLKIKNCENEWNQNTDICLDWNFRWSY